MLRITGNASRFCDRISRRSLLRWGSLGLAGLTLPTLLRQRAKAGTTGGGLKDKSVILFWMGGGPSHLDMYDLKPAAPLEFRGDFKPIATNLPGVQISEHMPLQARLLDKLTILRSVTHDDPNHGPASHMLLTGRKAPGGVDSNLFPSLGSVVAKMRGANAPGLPPYVVLPKEGGFGKAAYLGAAYNPFAPGSDPAEKDFKVQDLQLPGKVSASRLSDRHALLKQLDTVRRDLDTQDVSQSMDSFYRDALEMITSHKAQQAFDLRRENDATRERYGQHDWGQSTLLARRLVESGVTFVTVYMNGWDTHSDNFNGLKNKKLPKYDQALSALVEDLHARGLDDRVLVMAFGEFGRTPRVDTGQAGRGHWPGAMSVVVAGGGLKMGQVVGRTDSHAEYPVERPISPHDVLATLYDVVGVDPKHAFFDAANRPLPILSEGKPIVELTG
jgi:hypothetical protein